MYYQIIECCIAKFDLENRAQCSAKPDRVASDGRATYPQVNCDVDSVRAIAANSIKSIEDNTPFANVEVLPRTT